MFTVDELLSQAEEQGKIITVSVFEVYQDRVSDLLDARHGLLITIINNSRKLV